VPSTHSPSWTRRLRSGVFREMVGVVLVSIGVNAIGYGIYLLLTWLGIRPLLAVTILYPAGVAASFVGNRQLTFAHEGNAVSAAVRYLVVQFGGYLINLSLLLVFTERFGLSHEVAQAGAVVVVAAYLFVTLRHFVFRKPARESEMP
jgi:putative flippase GtrA